MLLWQPNISLLWSEKVLRCTHLYKHFVPPGLKIGTIRSTH